MLVEVLGAHIGLVIHALVGDGLEIGIERVGAVGALNLEQQLAFANVVVKARLDIDHTAAGQRDDRDFASDVGKHRSSNVKLSRRIISFSPNQRELVGLIDRDQAHVAGGDYIC